MNKRDPNDLFWKDANYGDLDASFCFLVKPRTRDLLIYPYGGGEENQRTFIPGHHMDKIWSVMIKDL